MKIFKFVSSPKIKIWTGICLFVVILRYLGLLLPIEWIFYDWLFRLKALETRDERIVIVSWDEEQIKYYKEGSISDRKLVQVLETIREQNPSVIGLDLYRDVPVADFELGKLENERAEKRLQSLFKNTPNLVGIAKVLPPFIEAPEILEEVKRVASADLLVDDDGFVRRGWLYPDPKGQADKPGLGLSVAIKYLIDGEFKHSFKKGSLLFENEEGQLSAIFRPWNRFEGSYLEKYEEEHIPINWRKQGDSPFVVVSVRDILSGEINSDTFTEKIVLIGNTSASASDKHSISLDRPLRATEKPTNGVEIHAHLATTLISHVLDGRPIIKSIPEWAEIGILLFSVAAIIFPFKLPIKRTPVTILLLTSGISLSIILLLTATASLSFNYTGFYIAIIPAAIASILSPSVFCLVVYIDDIKVKKQKITAQNREIIAQNQEITLKNQEITNKNEEYKLLLRSMNHSLRNHNNSILGNSRKASSITEFFEGKNTDDLIDYLYEYEQDNGISASNKLAQNIRIIKNTSNRLSRYQQQLEKYLKLLSEKRDTFIKEPTPLNAYLKDLADNIISLKQEQYEVNIIIEESYDSQINTIFLNQNSFDLAIENLLENAINALKNKQDREIIKIETKLENERVLIIIEDNGTGISPQFLERIFEKFITTKGNNQGYGLGLALVRRTLELHGGTIEAESSLGEWTKFIISLPISINSST